MHSLNVSCIIQILSIPMRNNWRFSGNAGSPRNMSLETEKHEPDQEWAPPSTMEGNNVRVFPSRA